MILVISAHNFSRRSAEWVMRKETGMISIARIPTWSFGSNVSRPCVELSSERKLVYGYSPIPMPCRKTTGSFVLDVCLRYQYVECLAGLSWRERYAYGRNGQMVKKRLRDVRWNWNPWYDSLRKVRKSTNPTHCIDVSPESYLQLERESYKIPNQASMQHINFIQSQPQGLCTSSAFFYRSAQQLFRGRHIFF